jgi:hypothetical protein
MGRVTPLFTSLKTLNITYQTPQETLLETPETLPTTEPETPQISYTVAEADLPTFNMQPFKKTWVAYLIAAGKVVTGATIYFRMKKNGESVASGSSSITANYFYTRNCYFYDVAVDDVLEIALWSNRTDSNWDYKACQVQVTRLILQDKPRLLVPCAFAALTPQPSLTLGNPSISATNPLCPCHVDEHLQTITDAKNYESLQPKDTYGLFRIYSGDYLNANASTSVSHDTFRPRYTRNRVPTQLVMRGLREP